MAHLCPSEGVTLNLTACLHGTVFDLHIADILYTLYEGESDLLHLIGLSFQGSRNTN